MPAFVLAIFTHVVLGIAVLLLGGWVHRRVDQLVPAHLDERERGHRKGILVRGVWACRVVGVVLLVLVIVPFAQAVA